MFTSVMRGIAGVVVAAAPLLGQARPAMQTAAGAEAAPTGRFETGRIYAGPRLWIGNLNGAVAIGAQAERGFTTAGQFGPGIIGGGVGIDYYTWDFDYTVGNYNYSVIPLQAFSNYHFVIESNRKIDPYVGLALVYSIVNASWEGAGVAAEAEANNLAFAGQGGVRYFLNDKVALQGQVGFGYGTLGLGATWKF
jgi:hypothetical protein